MTYAAAFEMKAFRTDLRVLKMSTANVADDRTGVVLEDVTGSDDRHMHPT